MVIGFKHAPWSDSVVKEDDSKITHKNTVESLSRIRQIYMNPVAVYEQVVPINSSFE